MEYMVVLFVEAEMRVYMIFNSERIFKPISYSLSIITFCLACSNESVDTVFELSDAPIVEILTIPYIDDPYYQTSLNSMIQANNSRLLVTPANPVAETVLFGYNINAIQQNEQNVSSSLINVINQGTGPFEASRIMLSSKNVTGDTLSFMSENSSKIILINTDNEISEFFLDRHIAFMMGDSFTFSGGHIGFSIEPRFGDGHLIGVYNITNGNLKTGLPLRVPIGFQPAIRNRVFTSAAVPGGFVFYFVGDRSFYYVNYDAEISGVFILGKDDPISKPYTINNPMDAPSARPHIPKMEFSNGYLHILMDGLIWIIDLDNGETIRKLKFFEDSNDQLYPLEFTTNNNTIFLRHGRDRILRAQIDHSWYER